MLKTEETEEKNYLKSEIHMAICSASVASKQADSEANVLVEKVKKKMVYDSQWSLY